MPGDEPNRPWEGEDHIAARPFSMVGMANNNNGETNNNHKDPLRSSPIKLNPFSIESLLSRGQTTVSEPLAAES